jgi:predicted ArsR family transcriptional regulator
MLVEHGATRARILAALRAQPATAVELAKELGLESAGVRRHLEDLLRGGLVTAEFRHGKVGRPKKTYALTQRGRETGPRRYPDLLLLLARTITAERGPQELDALMAAAGDGLARASSEEVPLLGSPRARAEQLAKILRDLDFPVEVQPIEGGFRVIRRDCIFLKLARAHERAVCGAFDETFLSRLTGARVVMERRLARGDNACVHEFHWS